MKNLVLILVIFFLEAEVQVFGGPREMRSVDCTAVGKGAVSWDQVSLAFNAKEAKIAIRPTPAGSLQYDFVRSPQYDFSTNSQTRGWGYEKVLPSSLNLASPLANSSLLRREQIRAQSIQIANYRDRFFGVHLFVVFVNRSGSQWSRTYYCGK